MTWGEWAAIRRLQEAQRASDLITSDNLQHVGERLQALTKSLREVAITLGVTMDILEKAGLLDVPAIHARVAEELAKVSPPANIVCLGCGASVPPERTTITAAGTVCDACANR